ncbi:hypothetical protein TELCIR_05836 [Teladorsagia circumcincta]|uniref:Sulfur globule protein CV3 domain protein n=1 Tax=Teladorsagia circumcincta TaxID=45464 RepID=A0A2G9URB2_TELCI|nr:hypothetical protein TELCIR_05836 [Teladorsagia circumcincta]
MCDITAVASLLVDRPCFKQMYLLYALFAIVVSVAAAPTVAPKEKDINEDLPPMNPLKGSFCVRGGYGGGYYPYGYRPYGYGPYGYRPSGCHRVPKI